MLLQPDAAARDAAARDAERHYEGRREGDAKCRSARPDSGRSAAQSFGDRQESPSVPPVTVAAPSFWNQMTTKTPEKWGNGAERIAEPWEIVVTDDFFVARVRFRTDPRQSRQRIRV